MSVRDSHSEGLRNRSGKVDSSDPLAIFLYILLRDHLPAGVVEGILKEHVREGTCQFSNGFLASYALDIKKRLEGAKPSKGMVLG